VNFKRGNARQIAVVHQTGVSALDVLGIASDL